MQCKTASCALRFTIEAGDAGGLFLVFEPAADFADFANKALHLLAFGEQFLRYFTGDRTERLQHVGGQADT